MTKQVRITWAQFDHDCQVLADRHRRQSVTAVYGVPTGGCFVAQRMCQDRDYFQQVDSPCKGCLVVDDLVDSGRTLEAYKDYVTAVVYRKPHSPQPSCVRTVEGWVKFPWEGEHGPEDAVVRLLQSIGEDPTREGLRDTPKRVVKAWREMTEGMQEEPAKILERQFDLVHDELVLIKDIPFVSLCEHHISPFSGTAAVAYIPSNGKVVGLSKLARLVLCFAKRLQVQERLTSQIVDAIVEHLRPTGAACVLQAEHSCMACRGVKVSGASFVTSAMRGVFRTDVSARAELMSLLGTTR